MTTTITYGGRHGGDHVKVVVTAGDTSTPVYVSSYAVIGAFPGSGGSINVQATWSLPVEVDAGTARWVQWDAGSVSAQASQELKKATAVRFIAVGADGIGEVSR